MKMCSFLMLVSLLIMSACQPAKNAFPDELLPVTVSKEKPYPRQKTACQKQQPKGCYCRADGVWIGKKGQPAAMDGRPIKCVAILED